MANLLTTSDVAKELKITPRRVQAMIASGKLKAQKIGPIYLMRSADVEKVRVRKNGRPSTG